MSKRPQEFDHRLHQGPGRALLRENDLTEIEVKRDHGEEGALTVRVARQVTVARTPPPVAAPLQIATAPAPAPAAPAAPQPAADPAEDPGVVPSPMVGTGYL